MRNNVQFKDEQITFWNSLQYVSLPGKHFSPMYQYEYNAIFEFWSKQWTETFTEINKNELIDATEFCRHEEVTALFYQGRVIAVALTDFFDIKNPVHKKHKNFINYNETILNQVLNISKSKPIRNFGYLCISKDFRSEYYIADIILGLSIQRTSELHSSVMVAYSRNTRKTNELGYRLGAVPLFKDVRINGEPSDFLYFDQSSIEFMKSHPLYPQIIHIWKNRISAPSPNIEFYYKNFNTTTTKGLNHENNQFRNSLQSNSQNH